MSTINPPRKMSPKVLAVFFVLAQLVRASESATWVAAVPVVSGNCEFEGRKVAVNGHINLEDPCEVWSCIPFNASHGYLSGGGCGLRRTNKNCKSEPGKGVYPSCCNVEVCPDDA
ncbi:U-scoloptoxin(16)-Sm4a-like [Haemaphysalis longicornis]